MQAGGMVAQEGAMLLAGATAGTMFASRTGADALPDPETDVVEKRLLFIYKVYGTKTQSFAIL